ncbi:hypothetical protein Tsubulata_043472, partial [Turnera subulata]
MRNESGKLISSIYDLFLILALISLVFTINECSSNPISGEDRLQLETTGFSCNSDLHTEICLANKQVRIDNNALKVYIPSSQAVEKRLILPYPRKEDKTAMDRFVITDYKPWWVDKYKKVLSNLSSFEVINPGADGTVHCFPGAVIGLKYHDNLAINGTGIPAGYSMSDFKRFLIQSFNLKIKRVSEVKKPPVLVLISRSNTRRFLNEHEMIVMMKELGFEVIVADPMRMTNLDQFAEVLNSCSVLVGAHGAGLTNEIFLPEGAVTVQVVGLGLEWAATTYYGDPASEMGVKYLEYKIEPEESTLLEKYGRDHPVIVDPNSIYEQGYFAVRAVYVDGQNMKINLN